ncbi:hypothetical protein HDU98_005908, partial [Podochytrium sp. JEL0797]
MADDEQLVQAAAGLEIKDSGATDPSVIGSEQKVATVERPSLAALPRVSITQQAAIRRDKTKVILHVLCVTFHHRNGPQ